MVLAKIPSTFQAVFIVSIAAGGLYAEGKVYSGFGARLEDPKPVVLEMSQPMPHVTMTSYQASPDHVDKFHVVDEEASVRFRLVGLPADASTSDYRVSWKFDENHHGSDEQAINPAETSTVNIRYNTANSNHHIMEINVASADGHWAGKTSFPVFGRSNGSVDVADGNVLLVSMKPKQTDN